MIVVSSKWMSQVHSLVPLTEQEEEVSHILLQHAVFPMSNRMHVVDFVLPGQRIVMDAGGVRVGRGRP